MKKLLLFFLLFATVNAACQQPQTPYGKFNLDFEEIGNGLPAGWQHFGTEKYVAGIDSTVVHSGKYSAVLEYGNDAPVGFKAFGMTIPGSYEGKQITLTGFIKTKNVTDGYAGLWLRIDPNIGFDNMYSQGITGTTDWKEYTIILPLQPAATLQIVVGGMLQGKGKMWIDGFRVTVDGKDISDLKLFVIEQNAGLKEVSLAGDNPEALYELGLIWGFLKYYHPAVAAGKYDWDAELFKIIPQITAAKSKVKRYAILTDWIDGLGKVTPKQKSAQPEGEVKISPDLEWIEKSGFPRSLVSALNNVRNAERKNENHYVSLYPGIGNPQFNNENSYGYMQYPNAGFQLLSLYRYWNMIQYYFPYKNLIEEDWKDVLKEFIPKFAGAENKTDYVMATLEIIARIHDTHANIWGYVPELATYKGLYFTMPKITFIEGQAVITGFYEKARGEKAGLKIGDIIVSVNGRKTGDIINDELKFTPASNYPTKLRDIACRLLRSNDKSIEVSYLRDGVVHNATLELYSDLLEQEDKEAFKILPGNIGYLYPGTLNRGEINDLWKEIEGTKGLIIDMRCYPSDFIVFTLGEKLIPQPAAFVKFSTGNIEEPGFFTMTPDLYVGRSHNRDYYKGKVIIIVNEQTQSNAEYTTMAFRAAPNAVVIGSTTAGADGNVSKIVLPGGIDSMISGIGVYYPDGTETQRVGIVPDIEMRPTIKAIAEGRDELLEKAMELINKE